MSEILILSPFFFPEPISTGKYNGLVAQGLQAAGFDVKVICSYPIYPDWVPDPNPIEMDGVCALRGGKWLKYPKSPLLRRAVLEPWFAFHTATQMLMRTRGGGRIVAVFPPSLFMMVVPLLKSRNASVIGVVHDLQGVYAARKSGVFAKILQSVIGWVERRAFESCDHLVFLSETMRDLTLSTYGLEYSSTSVHYPFVTVSSSVGEDSKELDKYFDCGVKTFVYSGALGEKQAPAKLVEVIIGILDRHKDWQARIFSQGPTFEQLRRSFSHPRLKFFPLIEERLLPALLHRSDMQIIPQDSGTSDGSLPSKLPNIIAAGTRLLCITDSGSELQRIVNAYSAGQACASWDVEAGISAFEQLKDRPLPSSEHISLMLKPFTLGGLIDRLVSVERKQ